MASPPRWSSLVNALATTGCCFVYHGDFDWPGVALANRASTATEPGRGAWAPRTASTWPLSARLRTSLLGLEGPPISADWDADLAPAMTALGVALHEEATFDLLMDDLLRQAWRRRRHAGLGEPSGSRPAPQAPSMPTDTAPHQHPDLAKQQTIG
ncbi:DUF2399 domain-containing protein [Streptomyces sp. NPDC096934]|uniref:DUF2399 domain-containing protein n=1 Tax=Streptomyces sp. NPDC096934 TaxID=3155551 RepID=UPI00332F70F9